MPTDLKAKILQKDIQQQKKVLSILEDKDKITVSYQKAERT